ncbi:hypothetical protein H310_03915 [Aphanomyces invadans]|uniref:PX domain-containing protein n=1 Tax=Aphanomyces invadans TaxID=157072 RepID=A0A024UES0_9STRA|nr:hypothetical protein H310_03915 [Aphanomyces invadans]ETW04774.1 hypothetical protein H310_03915 [Aphanomyces invadans]|eukprot:XP_008866212.1 hypothetical protein H310_03915 [Aphanomyces invadans]
MSSACGGSSSTACILRDIHAEVVDVHVASSTSPVYVVLVLPKVGPFVQALGTLPSHTVARTYSEWRQLYKTLLNVSNSTRRTACTCVLGSCPFWTMHLIVQSIPFPRKELFRWRRSPDLLQARKRALAHFVTTVVAKLQIYRPEIFDSSRTFSASSASNQSCCRFLRTLETFLGLDDDAIVRQFTSVSHKSRLQLTLEGWHSHRRNLFCLSASA